jgi:DNA-binding NarL/FixJ family response regulator
VPIVEPGKERAARVGLIGPIVASSALLEFLLARISLTRAELDVVKLVSEGLGNKDVATRLFISPRTV